MSEPTDDQASIALGTWIGREQAFNTIAHHCSAARVACLKHVRDTGAYKSVSKTWDEFCREHAGISRVHADRLIRQLAESYEQESGSGLGPLITYSINKLNQLSGMLTVHPEWERLRPPDVEETG